MPTRDARFCFEPKIVALELQTLNPEPETDHGGLAFSCSTSPAAKLGSGTREKNGTGATFPEKN